RNVRTIWYRGARDRSNKKCHGTPVTSAGAPENIPVPHIPQRTLISPGRTPSSCSKKFLNLARSAHGRPNFLGVFTGKGHIILRRGATFKIKTEHASSIVSLANQIEVDRRLTRALFFILDFDKPHRCCLPVECENNQTAA